MVHQKNEATQFDFATEGIKMIVEGDWVKAEGTTLGADNGIGVATIMALLASTDTPHPPLEALFTIDEETGMTGALELKAGLLDASIMLNLDTEDDDELTIGCAGGVDITASGTYSLEAPKDGSLSYKLSVKGLTGGHSGMDIHKGRGNANKIINRILSQLSDRVSFQIASVDGGGLRNAIPRESKAVIYIDPADTSTAEMLISEYGENVVNEHNTTDPSIEIIFEAVDADQKVMPKDMQTNLLRTVYACPNGIYRMSPDIASLVQTSNNLARVLVNEGKYEILCLTRSSVNSEKDDLTKAIKSTFELLGSEVKTGGSYPGWTPKPEAAIVKLMSDLYRNRFEAEPNVNACHAGLECGILGQNYPEMDMISFGPNIRGAHSPDEKVQISSVQKFWGFLLETLQNTPAKN
jgi:dipeptidase D